MIKSFALALAIILTTSTIAPSQVGTSCADCANYSAQFSIANQTGVTIPYQVRWGDDQPWKNVSLRSGQIETHSYPLGDNKNAKFPRPYVRFDRIAGDNRSTPLAYHMEAYLVGYAGFGQQTNNGVAKRYFFEFSADGKSLNMFAR